MDWFRENATMKNITNTLFMLMALVLVGAFNFTTMEFNFERLKNAPFWIEKIVIVVAGILFLFGASGISKAKKASLNKKGQRKQSLLFRIDKLEKSIVEDKNKEKPPSTFEKEQKLNNYKEIVDDMRGYDEYQNANYYTIRNLNQEIKDIYCERDNVEKYIAHLNYEVKKEKATHENNLLLLKKPNSKTIVSEIKIKSTRIKELQYNQIANGIESKRFSTGAEIFESDGKYIISNEWLKIALGFVLTSLVGAIIMTQKSGDIETIINLLTKVSILFYQGFRGYLYGDILTQRIIDRLNFRIGILKSSLNWHPKPNIEPLATIGMPTNKEIPENQNEREGAENEAHNNNKQP